MSRPTSPATIQARILGISTRSFKANFGSAERYLAMKPEAQALMVNMARQRKVLRLRLGAAKRAVGAVGKRINAEASK